MRYLIFVLLFMLVPVQRAFAQDARLYSVTAGSTATYKIVHKFHEVTAICKTPEGKMKLLPNGTSQVMVRARVDCFDSDNGNRDAHMKEVTEAQKFPFVEFKGLATGVKPAGTFEIPLKGTVTFHGIQQPLETKAKVVFADAVHATVEFAFKVSLDAFKVERPSLMFTPIDDALEIGGKFILEGDKP